MLETEQIKRKLRSRLHCFVRGGGSVVQFNPQIVSGGFSIAVWIVISPDEQVASSMVAAATSVCECVKADLCCVAPLTIESGAHLFFSSLNEEQLKE